MDEKVIDRVFAEPNATFSEETVHQFKTVGGVVIGPPALDSDLHRALSAEAESQIKEASWQLEGVRKAGEIDQSNRRAHLGPVARAYLSSCAIRSWLRLLTGEELVPSWSATCFTRYTGPSEHMGEHCDKADACKYNVLTYLDATWPYDGGPSSGMQLFMFKGDNSQTGLALSLTARSNRIAAIFGSRHAHLRPPLAEGEILTMLAGCFRTDA